MIRLGNALTNEWAFPFIWGPEIQMILFEDALPPGLRRPCPADGPDKDSPGRRMRCRFCRSRSLALCSSDTFWNAICLPMKSGCCRSVSGSSFLGSALGTYHDKQINADLLDAITENHTVLWLRKIAITVIELGITLVVLYWAVADAGGRDRGLSTAGRPRSPLKSPFSFPEWLSLWASFSWPSTAPWRSI